MWLERARKVTDGMLARFWDEGTGGFYMSEEDVDAHLIARPKSPYDGAIPSGNSAAVRALAVLAAMSGENHYRGRALSTVSSFSVTIEERPTAFSYMLLGTDELLPGAAGGYSADREHQFRNHEHRFRPS